MPRRYIEIDLLRTVAILLMVIYHAAYDLWAFYGYEIDLFGTGWQTLRVITATLFLLVSGASAQFSNRPIRRAGIVLSCAMLISIVTYIYDPETFIYFGILHCIGIGMLLLIPLRKLKEWNVPLGILILLFPFSTFHFPFFVRPTLDYYPLIPWFGWMLIGSGLSHFLYIRNTLHVIQAHPGMGALRRLTLPARHALLIYMIHQPILLAVLYAIHTLTPET